MKYRCPICKRTFRGNVADNKFYPFCSERCKLLDLGKWLDSEYKLTSPTPTSNSEERGKKPN